MPNIMVTKRCNLRCEYCFANGFVNQDMQSSDISISSFREILDFILQDGSINRIGIIGGEPTLHPRFGDLLEILLNDNRLEGVTIYTNGIKLRQYMSELENKKFHLLINCNDIRNNSSQYHEFLDSVNMAMDNIGDRTILGVNYYKKGFDYSYLWELLNNYKEGRIRVSISVPNTKDYNYSPLKYFSEIKDEVFIFLKKLKERGIVPFLDCNIFPSCLITYEDWNQFDSWGIDNPLLISKSKQTICSPVIDIMPDYTAVRCFGLGEFTQVSIKEFASITDLRNYYIRSFDAYAVNCTYDNKCDSCYKYKTMKCSGGCLIYKINEINKKRSEIK